MAQLYRLSSLWRSYDLSLGYNRLILLLTALGAAVGLGRGLLVGQPFVPTLPSAFLGGVTVFIAATLAKEIDPDHPQSAVLAAVLALPAVWVANLMSLPALLWLLLVLRFVNRSTGLAPKVTDALVLLVIGGGLAWLVSPLFGVLSGGVLLLDALLPDGRRAHGPLGGLVMVAGVVYWLLNAGNFPPAPAPTWLVVALLALTIAAFGIILACYVILASGDATGRPVSSARFQAAQTIALAIGLCFASWHGVYGAVLFVALWAALVGAVIIHWLHAGSRRSAASL